MADPLGGAGTGLTTLNLAQFQHSFSQRIPTPPESKVVVDPLDNIDPTQLLGESGSASQASSGDEFQPSSSSYSTSDDSDSELGRQPPRKSAKRQPAATRCSGRANKNTKSMAEDLTDDDEEEPPSPASSSGFSTGSSESEEEYRPRAAKQKRAAPKKRVPKRNPWSGSESDDNTAAARKGGSGPRGTARNASRKVQTYRDNSDSCFDSEDEEAKRAYNEYRRAEELKPGIHEVVNHMPRAMLVAEARKHEAKSVGVKQEVSAAGVEGTEGGATSAQGSDAEAHLGYIEGTGGGALFLNTVDADALERGGAPDDVLYCIKWKDKSHLHNTWHMRDAIRAMDIKGLKKLDNYVKLWDDTVVWLAGASVEEIEFFFSQMDMRRGQQETFCDVERVFAVREAPVDQAEVETKGWDAQYQTLYFCKWSNLPYSESTWETAQEIADQQAAVDAFLQRQSSATLPSKPTRKVRMAFKSYKETPTYLAKGGLALRDYQVHGLNWMAQSWCKGKNVILADEMGLGKTIQSIALLSYLFHVQKIYGPFLMVLPLSTVMAWQREFLKWAPVMNSIVYTGDRPSRQIIRDHELYDHTGRVKFNVLITTYETVRTDADELSTIKWASMMVDEAHRLKNDSSALYKTLCTFDTCHKMLITGTPLQNSLRELWALLHFLMPREFDSWEMFEDQHGSGEICAQDPRQLRSLHAMLAPYLLRRVKKDVEKSLPPKSEQILRVDMTQAQKSLYRLIIERNFSALRQAKAQSTSLLNIVMELKKTANHTFLVQEQPVLDAAAALRALRRGSGKMMLLDKLLTKLSDKGHRVLIFSQMVTMLDVLAQYLRLRGFLFQRLDGGVRHELRKQALDHFNAPDSKDFCFLLSTRAGGLGINLATADTVIIFDSDWNPQNDLQAMARAHRIGQKKKVSIYRLVTRGTVEEDILERAKQKMVLDHLIIQRMDTSGILSARKTQAPNFDKDELNAIMKFGAEELFKDADVDGDKQLEEMDIDEVLKQAEEHDSSAQPTSLGDELLSQFKTVDIEMNEEEDEPLPAAAKANPKGEKRWEDIVPQHVQAKMLEEERQAEVLALYMPKRKRRAAQRSKAAGDDEDDDDDEQPIAKTAGSAATRRKKPTGETLDKPGLDMFCTADVKRVVRGLRKFGDTNNRIPQIIAEAQLSAFDGAKARELIEHVLSFCHECQAAKKPSTAADKPSIAGVRINTKDLLLRVDGLTALAPRLVGKGEEFRLGFRMPPPSWGSDCLWGPKEDANLLRGVYNHGYGAWDVVVADPSLGLSGFVDFSNPKRKPQKNHLEARADSLLLHLLKAKGKPEPREKKRKSKPKGSEAGATDDKKKSKAAPSDGTAKPKKKRKQKQLSLETVGVKSAAKQSRSDPKQSSPSANDKGKVAEASAAAAAALSASAAAFAAGAEADKSSPASTAKPAKATGATSEAPALLTASDDDFADAAPVDPKQLLSKAQGSMEALANLLPGQTTSFIKKHVIALGNEVQAVLSQTAPALQAKYKTAMWDYCSTALEGYSGSKMRKLFKKLSKQAPTSEGQGGAKSASAPKGHKARTPSTGSKPKPRSRPPAGGASAAAPSSSAAADRGKKRKERPPPSSSSAAPRSNGSLHRDPSASARDKAGRDHTNSDRHRSDRGHHDRRHREGERSDRDHGRSDHDRGRPVSSSSSRSHSRPGEKRKQRSSGDNIKPVGHIEPPGPRHSSTAHSGNHSNGQRPADFKRSRTD
eukprot:m.226706 g.226706  ORF g.226706 m.226706 type:complete len:1728 (+) comp18803_c0_seq1:562-5745(+)